MPDTETVFSDTSLIAIFGATGTGKTTFVNDASGGSLVVGHGAHACTQDVSRSPTFEVDGRQVVLFDTPGFDDTHLSDTEVLKRIAGFLAESYKEGYKLTGIIYLHRITDIRVGGISRRTFNVFRQLCGNSSLSNVLIVTNMWSDPPTPVEIEREIELRDHPDFFQPALLKGAKMARRTHKDQASAHEIVRMLLGKQTTTMTIQKELVDQEKDLAATGAGKILEREPQLMIERHRLEMEQAKQDMEDAVRERDEQAKMDLEKLQTQARADDAKRRQELESMRSGFGKEQARWKQEIEAAKASQRATQAEQDRVRAELERTRNAQRTADAQAQQQLRERIAQLERDLASRRSGGCIIA
ncbi:hypothetical protein FRC09_012904 [Ceratobasidium sp. 395]|nr:hypothetical protein FRC09_012904 [Ceratobasidium sp. 395]